MVKARKKVFSIVGQNLQADLNTVKHIEIDRVSMLQHVFQRFGQSFSTNIMILFSPMSEPTIPKLCHKYWLVRLRIKYKKLDHFKRRLTIYSFWRVNS